MERSPVTHLRSIAISAEQPSELLDFYQDTWGLRLVDSEPDGGLHLRARGTEHHVFSLLPGDGHSLDLITLAARSVEAVDDVAERALAAGAPVLAGPGPSGSPGGGYSVVVRDPEGRVYEVSADVAGHAGPPPGSAGPDRLSHIVLNAVNLPASRDFLLRVLGFRVSDWYDDDAMVFLTCNEVHHSIVLTPGRWTSLNHVAFEVASGDEVMRALGRMRTAGYNTIWGPGRHGPGGNVFCYFVDPVGNVIEYTAELLTLGDSWQPSGWVRNADNADVWGTSGGITPAVIQAMSNPPAHVRGRS